MAKEIESTQSIKAYEQEISDLRSQLDNNICSEDLSAEVEKYVSDKSYMLWYPGASFQQY